MNVTNRKIIMNSFFISKLNYCLFFWIFHSLSMNNKINRLHEYSVYSDNALSFEELLQKDESVTIHINIQKLATELFKVYKNLSPTIVSDLFNVQNDSYNFRHWSYFLYLFFFSWFGKVRTRNLEFSSRSIKRTR